MGARDSSGGIKPLPSGASATDGLATKDNDAASGGRLSATPATSGNAVSTTVAANETQSPESPAQLPGTDSKSPSATAASTSADDIAQQRQAQVSFPPGTKGSPLGTPKLSGRELGNANKPLSIKPPAAKPSEPLSSPASTSHSAATPAVHEASTDTSPDNEASRPVEEAVKPKDAPQALGEQEQSGPEAQLLQESTETADSHIKQEDRPTSVSAGPKQSEVPDSEGGTPDRMDVDATAPQSKPSQAPAESSARAQESSPVAGQTSPTKTEPSQVPERPERAVTRVSSGAMRLKSVTEIVGGAPARTTNVADREAAKDTHDQLTPVTSTPQSPTSKSRLGHHRERSKGQVSTVLFGKQPKKTDEKAVVPGQKEPLQPSDDYYTPLFVQNFTGTSNWMQPIEKILFQANKTIATPDANLVIQDHQACRVLRRVYHLQQHDKWSLRQLKRCPEPNRPSTQWDVLLKEVKWMRTDFREERKWKMAVARNLAHACAQWCEASPEDRKAMQVAATIPPKESTTNGADVSMSEADADQPTPDLVSSCDMDSPQPVDELADHFVETIAPSALFSLQEDDVVFGLRKSSASDALLEELPMYGSPLKVPPSDLTGSDYDPDAHWRRPALPLSKYVEGDMRLVTHGPPAKRSRFAYQNEDSDDDEQEGEFGDDQAVHSAVLPAATDEVALFQPDSKHVRDRLHAGHQFRPPSEHPMPVQSFYECRGASQWTVTEDDELRGLVREYSYNWSLISSLLSTRSLFTSGAERRTPWECFERWILLEGLPADMQKTQYFKAYNSRIDAAQRVIAQQNQIASQQANASGGAITPLRRRPSIPTRVERRRNQKHLTMLDAMRKLAKKRETAIQKQQHSAAQNSATKKTSDNISQRPRKTPRDYSLLRWERDQALAEKMAQYAQRQDAQRRVSARGGSQNPNGAETNQPQAAIQARAQGQSAQAAGAGAVGAAPGNVNRATPAAGQPNIPNQLAAAAAAAAAAQGRPRMPMQVPTNGGAVGVPQQQQQQQQAQQPQGQMNSAVNVNQMSQLQQAQLQAMQGQQQRLPVPNQQPDANLMLRAQRISEQQRAQIQQAQHQHPQQPGQQQQQANGINMAAQHGSPPLRNGVNGLSHQTYLSTAQAMMAQYNAAAAANGHTSPQPNGQQQMAGMANGAQPRPYSGPLPPAIAAQLAQLEANFRAKNANLTPEQARQLATEHLTRAMMAQRQTAMNAAAGATGQAGLANNMVTTSPHQYAALLRQQQQQQAALQQQQQQRAGSHSSPTPGPAGSPAQHQRQSSGSATPGPK